MFNFLGHHKKSIVTVLSVAVAGVLLLCAFTGESSQEDTASETVYRESIVERGNITVGITETATATLQTHALTFDVSAELEEIFVKAGQTVQSGDPIASISTESINEEISTLQADYQEAALKLSEANLARQKGELEAQNTYDSSLNKSDTAESTYEKTVEKLEREITQAERTIEQAERDIAEITSEIRVYRVLMGYNFGSERYEDFINSSFYTLKYDKDFEDEDEIVLAEADAKERLEDAEYELENAKLALADAEYDLDVQTGEAALTKDKTIATGQLADTIYEMELKSLANDVTSKQLAMDNIQEQIAKYNGYLGNTMLTAPCDGVVTAVSYEAGADIQAGTAVATVSDSDNVYVYIAVAQDDITGVSLGQSASVTMDAFEDIGFEGVVDSITTTPARSASGSASYNVTIQLLGDTAQVYEGMTGSATLITRQQQDVLYVTNRTVYQQDGTSYVKVKNNDGSVEEVAVQTGFSDGRNVEITEGLQEGQTVLIESQVAAGQ